MLYKTFKPNTSLNVGIDHINDPINLINPAQPGLLSSAPATTQGPSHGCSCISTAAQHLELLLDKRASVELVTLLLLLLYQPDCKFYTAVGVRCSVKG